MSDKPYTEQQRKAIWLFLTHLSQVFNDAGLDLRAILKPEINIPFTKEIAHDHLWIPIQQMMFGTDSLTKLKKQGEIDQIYEVLVRELGEKHHIEVPPFPNDPTREDAPLLSETPIWRQGR